MGMPSLEDALVTWKPGPTDYTLLE